MALFLDGLPVTVEGLAAYDAYAAETARVEGIDLPGKLRLAQERLEAELTEMVSRLAGGEAGHFPVKHVAVTAALRNWFAETCLALLYGNAANNLRNERHGKAAQEHKERGAEARRSLLAAGIGMVWRPVAKAAVPVVEPDEDLGGDALYVRVAFVEGECEGAASDAVSVLTSGQVRVRMARPAGMQWNVYVGRSLTELARQNGQPLDAEEWVQDAAALVDGSAPTEGQEPDFVLTERRRLQRG